MNGRETFAVAVKAFSSNSWSLDDISNGVWNFGSQNDGHSKEHNCIPVSQSTVTLQPRGPSEPAPRPRSEMMKREQ
jgi:hypothetical protein